jgi:hypothetical protein
MYILPLLGTGLYNRLQDGIEANNLTQDETDLLVYVRDPLIYFTVARLVENLSYQIWNKCVLKKGNEGSETVSKSELIDLKNRYMNDAEYYAQRLVRWLMEEANNNKFPLYINPGNRTDTIVPKRNAYNTGIYLGSGYDDCKGCDDSRERQYGKK